MRTAWMIGLLLVLAGVIGGCLAPENGDDCPAEGCPDENSEPVGRVPPPPRGDLELPDALYPSFQGRDCEQFAGFFEVPYDNLRAVVPDAFIIRSAAPGILGGIQLRIFQCPETLDNGALLGPSHFHLVFASAHPANDTWYESGTPSFYIIEAAADNEAWNQAVENAFLEIEWAEFDVSKLELPTGAFVADVTISANHWDLTASFGYNGRSSPQESSAMINLWYGEGPFHRINFSSRYLGAITDVPGVVLHEGESKLGQALPTPVTYHALGNWEYDVNFLLQYDGAWTDT